jgi:hypothetical protein
MFSLPKIKQMRKCLHDEDRVFVNNIIATLSLEKVKLLDQDGNYLELDDQGHFTNSDDTSVTPTRVEICAESNIVGIVDGQHRIYCYHEGNDVYEDKIEQLRGVQNLLVTGILYPKVESEEKRLKFEAKLFMEINATQTGAKSQLKQEIEMMTNSFSSIAIAKEVLNCLNKSGPLESVFEEYWYERGKLKTASIIAYGLKPLVKLDGNDSLYHLWNHADKAKLIIKDSDD